MTRSTSHRTAIVRGDLSRPTRHALGMGVLSEGETFFDYGCGRGEDVAGLRKQGFDASGWDPNHRPSSDLKEADVVNIGYVVNVIAEASERVTALQQAWGLARKALVVAARLNAEQRTISLGRPLGDGYLTGHDTFQRFYSQAELRGWIDAVLDVESIAVAPGIFVIFREEDDANEFLLRNRRRREITVTISRADRLYDEHSGVLDELVDFFTTRGRLPRRSEVPDLGDRLRLAVRSVRRAWSIIEKITPDTDWEAVSTSRRDDLLVDLALLKLNRRPSFMALPEATRFDIKNFFGSYKAATAAADDLLFSAGDLQLIDAAASRSTVGKRLPTALYVHVSALDQLAPSLRVYEGCARWLVGDVDETSVIKLATDKPKVSYLSYPNFDRDPHPELRQATYVRLRGLDVDSRNYEQSENPPILHRKESFVGDDYPLRAKFARLTEQEERFGLLATDTRSIGNLTGWQERLAECGVSLRGHRIVRR